MAETESCRPEQGTTSSAVVRFHLRARNPVTDPSSQQCTGICLLSFGCADIGSLAIVDSYDLTLDDHG